ncbi:MAG: hypothetical protein WC994_07030 [Brumimicrobium sp.]
MKNSIYLFALLLFVSCGEQVQGNINKTEDNQIDNTATDVEEELLEFENELEFARFCLDQLKEENFQGLKKYANAEILFSPYAYIDLKTVRSIDLDDFDTSDEEIYFWGIYDGKGDSILLTNHEYLQKYVFNFDYNDGSIKTQIYTDKPNAYGSELHNIQEVYAGDTYVEFYKSPSEEGYLDWNALLIVVETIDGQYFLRAIIHNQWTI